jgi:EAL domain-containing protein (putative c-di-GMP-specific phosphodiesterase class I)
VTPGDDGERSGSTAFSSLLRDADGAMYSAKRSGGHRLVVADDTIRNASTRQLDTEIGIRRALAEGEFEPWFQPIVDREGRLHSFEALIRWRHPSEGLLTPYRFLPEAKAAGLLGEVSTFMLAAVCPIVAEWNTARIGAGLEPVNVHINCVEEQLGDFAFPDLVSTLLEFHGVDPSWILLEVSEETAVERLPRGLPTLQALRAMGVRFSLDDFGFGNSSLTMLRELGDVAELKLDKSIVDEVATEGIQADADVIDAILGFAKKRGITIVAEGVETPEQWDALRAYGVQLFQGYLFARPEPRADAAQRAMPVAVTV